MDVEFHNKSMKSRYDDPSKAIRKWGKQIGERYVRVVSMIMSANGFDELFDVPSLRLHPLRGNRKGEYSFRLNIQMRLIVEYDRSSRTVIVKEVSKHYGD